MTDHRETADTDCRHLQRYRWLVMDALHHAMTVAYRAQEATEGTPDTLLFDAVRSAIADFRANHPTMKVLGSAAMRHLS